MAGGYFVGGRNESGKAGQRRPSRISYFALAIVVLAAVASDFAAAMSISAMPLVRSATAAVSLAFFAASISSGIAPLPDWAQGFICLGSKPSPFGPTRQLKAWCIWVCTPLMSAAAAASPAWV